MKKVLLLILLAFFISSCGKPKEPPVDYDAIITEFQETLNIPETTSENLDLKASYVFKDQTITAVWQSSDEEALSNSGVVNRLTTPTLVDLTVTLTLKDVSKEFIFQIEIEALPKEDVAKDILALVLVPTETTTDIPLQTEVTYQDENYRITWSSKDPKYINNRGYIKYVNEDTQVTLVAKVKFNGEYFTKEFNVTIKKFDTAEMKKYLDEINIPSKTNQNLTLPTEAKLNKDYTITWESSNPDIINGLGVVNRSFTDTTVTLKATMKIDFAEYEKEYTVVVEKADSTEIERQLTDIYKLPGKTNRDLLLPTDLVYGLKGTWTSSKPDVMSNTGVINKNITKPTEVQLTLTVNLGGQTMTHTFATSVVTEKHMFVDSTFNGEKNNTKINEYGKLVLTDNALSGTYYSGQIDSLAFKDVVCSWAATSSPKATCELFVSLKVDGKWSEYITYGKFGLGLHNKSFNQSKDLIKLSDDEVSVKSGTATGFQYKIEIVRDNVNTPSCEVSLIALALNLINYKYDIDKSNLKNKVLYDVPKLYQHDVPGIGGIICSATSSTMLLKYHGHDFSSINPLEHEYIAGLVREYNSGIYGNWVYNTVGISGFGEKSYVKRFFGDNEFLYSVQEVGPMAASIRGDVYFTSTVTGNSGHYHTNGHLLVVTGFEITPTETYVYINDPNARGVSIKMTLPNFKNIWRGVSYIVE